MISMGFGSSNSNSTKSLGTGGNAAQNVPVVGSQLVASYGSITLSAGLQTQNVVLIPNYKNLDISSLTLQLNTSITNTATAPTNVNGIESVIKQFTIQANNGKNIWQPLDGSLYDISNYGRYLNTAGVVDNSPAFSATVSATVPQTWNINIPFAISRTLFPLKLFTTFNVNAAIAGTTNGSTAVVNSMSVLASYHDLGLKDAKSQVQLKPISVPVVAAGTASLQQYYDYGRVYYSQILSYGDVQNSDASDSPIGSTGTGITFTPNGELYNSNVPLEAYIAQENNRFPNTVAAGIGHETGLVNLFTDPFVAGAASELSIDFTSTPTVARNANSLRLLMIEGF